MSVTTLRRAALVAVLLGLYLTTAVPIGLLAYTIKTDVGFDIFRSGGMHAFEQCLRSSFPLRNRPPIDGQVGGADLRLRQHWADFI